MATPSRRRGSAPWPGLPPGTTLWDSARMSFAALAPLRVDPAQAVLLLIDFQERLAAVMDAAERAACERNILILVELARRLRIPVVQSEQYPRGLGPTVAAFTAALAAPDLQLTRLQKMEFACTEAPGFRALFDDFQRAGRAQWLVVGMESHVCVWQTARGLL